MTELQPLMDQKYDDLYIRLARSSSCEQFSHSTYGSHSTPSPTQLTVQHNRRITRVRAHDHVHQVAEIGKVGWFLRRNGYPPVIQSDIPLLLTLFHDIFQDFDFVGLDFLPDGDDGAIGRLGMQKELATELIELGDDVVLEALFKDFETLG